MARVGKVMERRQKYQEMVTGRCRQKQGEYCIEHYQTPLNTIEHFQTSFISTCFTLKNFFLQDSEEKTDEYEEEEDEELGKKRMGGRDGDDKETKRFKKGVSFVSNTIKHFQTFSNKINASYMYTNDFVLFLNRTKIQILLSWILTWMILTIIVETVMILVSIGTGRRWGRRGGQSTSCKYINVW